MSDKPAFRVLDAIVDTPWLIHGPKLKAIGDVVMRKLSDPDVIKQAVDLRESAALDGTRSVQVRDGVAIVPVIGTIFRRSDMFMDMSGGLSVETLARDFTAALENPKVKAIILNVDSPGGEANGIHELAEHIAASRGAKPIVAYVGGWSASAGYWLASAADEIVVDRTAELGSIGAVAIYRKGKGEGDLEIVSSQSPRKRMDPHTDEGKAEAQKQIDYLADVFIDRVASYRGVDMETVLADFGQGGMLPATEAIRAGLADRLGSLESLITELSSGRAGSSGLTINTNRQENNMARKKAVADPEDERLKVALAAKKAEESEEEEEKDEEEASAEGDKPEDDDEKDEDAPAAEEGEDDEEDEEDENPFAESDDDEEDEDEPMSKSAFFQMRRELAELRTAKIDSDVKAFVTENIATGKLSNYVTGGKSEAQRAGDHLRHLLTVSDKAGAEAFAGFVANKTAISGTRLKGVKESVIAATGSDHDRVTAMLQGKGIKQGSKAWGVAYAEALRELRTAN